MELKYFWTHDLSIANITLCVRQKENYKHNFTAVTINMERCNFVSQDW